MLALEVLLVALLVLGAVAAAVAGALALMVKRSKIPTWCQQDIERRRRALTQLDQQEAQEAAARELAEQARLELEGGRLGRPARSIIEPIEPRANPKE